jgi:hypothetical protein
MVFLVDEHASALCSRGVAYCDFARADASRAFSQRDKGALPLPRA